uniref:Uncharacterized protein n=1 Tax=Anguilla anguilla TaxID=7936 RepID=A0A0E9QYP3_ANGAN
MCHSLQISVLEKYSVQDRPVAAGIKKIHRSKTHKVDSRSNTRDMCHGTTRLNVTSNVDTSAI